MQCPFRGQSSGLSQLQARDGVTVFFSDFKILWLWLLMIDPMFGIQQYDTFTVFLLKILWYGCPTWKCRSRSWRKRLPILVVTFLSNGVLNHMMFLFRWRFRFTPWDDCNCEGVVYVSVLLKPLFFSACSYAGFALSNSASSHDIDDKPTCRLINPAKSEMGVISKNILDKINNQIRRDTGYNQWKNTAEVIEWFNRLPDKRKRTFIQFDIESFYPSIKLETLIKALTWAQTIVNISPMEREIIMHARRSLLFHVGATWIKKDGSDFDVTMGSYDVAEVCELVGLYMLHLLSQRLGIDFVGHYRDDGATAQILSKKQAGRARKDIIAIFKSCGFTITVEINLPRMDMLDVTFDLPSGKYWPYRKPNNEPLYTHSKSNHPPSILKHLPKNIYDRLSSISCDEAEFDKAKPAYEQALKNSGFNSTLTYTTPSQLQSSQGVKRKRQRKRNIIWFNTPFDKNVTTNIGRRFLQLLDLHFHVGHPYHRIFNRNTVKVSYCCMPNMGSIISSHNHKILKSEKKTVTPSRACNCDKPEDCPLKGHCMGVQCVVYKATINAPNHAEKYYYGLSEPEFKSRYANHKSSLKYPSKRNTTELSKYYWELRDKGVDKKDIKVDWRIERQAHKYKCGTRRCDLCLSEKLVIALADKSTMLNKRSETISACPHRTKYRYHKVTKVKMK